MGDIEYYPAYCRELYGNSREGWMNRIYSGDNLHVMSHLLRDFRSKIDLIYIDPPFNSLSNYTKKITVRDNDEPRSKGPDHVKIVRPSTNEKSVNKSIIEEQYRDKWQPGEYLQYMYDRLVLMRELLSDTGSIYVHCDWHVSHYLRLLMDEVFGPENFRNEIAWCYLVNKGHFVNRYPPRHDTILFYAKTSSNFFNREAIRMKPSPATLKRWGTYANKNGEVPYEKLTPGMKKVAGKGEKPYVLRGGIQVDWISSIPGINSGNSIENSGYPTQKPEKLIEIFIKASSKPGDLVLDCFMGSGTTLAAAMKQGRRFIGADINPGAIHTSVKRYLHINKTIAASLDNDSVHTGLEVLYTSDAKPVKNRTEADISIKKNMLIINNFYPQKLMEKLNTKKLTEKKEWRKLVDSIMIDFNYDYDRKILRPTEIDIPLKKKQVKGIYEIPDNAGTIRIKIIDLLSEVWEMTIIE